MSILREVLGPASKYDHRLPYTYEARVAVAGVPGMTDNYVCDTLCGLLERLGDEGVDPADATLLEIRPEGEFPILLEHCLSADGKWLRRPEACRSFEAHYAGHEKSGRCCYLDRSREADGPFVEYEPPVASGEGRKG
jgi:hypothetical protein